MNDARPIRRPSAKLLIALASGLLLLAVSGTLSTGCGPARRDAPHTEPLSATDPQVLAGQQVFSAHCYQCHPGGAGGLGPAINDKPLPVALIKTQVRKGLGAMPGFSKKEIDDAQLDDLVKYLKALRTLDEFAAAGR